MAQTWSHVLPWLVVALVALAGWGVGWLMVGEGRLDAPPVRVRIQLVAAETMPYRALQQLCQSAGLALLRSHPEIAIDFVEMTGPETVTVRVEARAHPAGVVLAADPPGPATVMPERLDVSGGTPGERVAAWLILQAPGVTVAEGARALTQHDVSFEGRLLETQARIRLAAGDASALFTTSTSLRALLGIWPEAAPESERLRLAEMLANALIEPMPSPTTAHAAYEALDLANKLLRAHWAAGRTAGAAAAHHLVARIRLALGQAEAEPRHLEAARESIAHALAHGPRSAMSTHRAADLALLGSIELAIAEHNPGTAALHRSAAASREAIGLTPVASPERTSRLLAAALALIDVGEREGLAGPLEEAVGLARQAFTGPSRAKAGLVLARALLALGEQTGRGDLIEEATSLAIEEATPAGRVLTARALEAQGRRRLDAAPISEAAAAWRTLAADPDVNQTRADRRQQARGGLAAARQSAAPELIDEAVALARSLARHTDLSGLARALDDMLLGEALLIRARARMADTAGADEAMACFDAALGEIGREPLPQLKARLAVLRREARRRTKLSEASITEAPRSEPYAAEPDDHAPIDMPALDAIAARLDEMAPATEARLLAETRRLVLLRLDAKASATSDLIGAPELDWLERIDKAQGRAR